MNNDAEHVADCACPPWLTMRVQSVCLLKGQVFSVDARSETTLLGFFVVGPFFLSCLSVSPQPTRFRGDVTFFRNEYIVIGNKGGSVR